MSKLLTHSEAHVLLRRTVAAIIAILIIQWGLNVRANAAPSFPVPLSITEDAGIQRILEPVSWGVPVPKEAGITDVDSLRLVDDSGTPVPVQLTVTARWDGAPGDEARPIRWVLVDMQASLEPYERADFFLEVGPRADAGDDLAISETPTVFQVDTGSSVFRLRKTRFNFLDSVWIDVDGDGTPETEVVPGNHDGGVEITPVGKSGYESATDSAPEIQVVLSGPMRTVVRLSGEFDSNSANDIIGGQLTHFEYTAYYHFYRNHDFARVQFAIRYPERDSEFDQHSGGRELCQEFDSFVVRMPTSLGDERTALIHGEGPTPWQGNLGAGESARIYQDSSGVDSWAPPAGGENHPLLATTFRGYRVYEGTGPAPSGIAATGNHASGYCDVHDGNVGVLVGMRDFWENFPKGIRLQHDGDVVFELFPSEWRTEHRFRGGLQKTHDLLVAFHADAGDSAAVRSIQEGFDNPLRLVAPNWVYRDSKALGLMAAEDKDMFWYYDTAAEAVIDYTGGVYNQGDIYKERWDDDLYGWMNYGDGYRAGSKSNGARYWGNNELDMSFCMLQSYLRDAEHDRRFFENGEAMVRQLFDIDMYHTDRDLFWANRGIRKHDASGTQDHSRAPNLSHHWLQGAKVYYWLTADPFARTFLQDAGTWLTNLEQPYGSGEIAFSGEIRSKGWLLNSFVDLFEFTGNQEYLDLIERMIPVIIMDVLQPGGYIVNSDRLVMPWQMSYITEGFGKYLMQLRALDQENPVALEALTRILGFLENDAWIPEQNRMAYYWDPFEKKVVEYSANITQTSADGFVYGYLLTGWAGYLDMANLCYESTNGVPWYPYYYSNTLATPAKNAGFRLRFGMASMWHRQMAAEDSTAGTIEGLQALDVTSNTARIAFETSEQSARIVFVWAQGEPMTWRKNFNYYKTEHSVYLPNLKSMTTYSAAVMTVDYAGNQSWSQVVEFTTPPLSLAPPEGGESMGQGGNS